MLIWILCTFFSYALTPLSLNLDFIPSLVSIMLMYLIVRSHPISYTHIRTKIKPENNYLVDPRNFLLFKRTRVYFTSSQSGNKIFFFFFCSHILDQCKCAPYIRCGGWFWRQIMLFYICMQLGFKLRSISRRLRLGEPILWFSRIFPEMVSQVSK